MSDHLKHFIGSAVRAARLRIGLTQEELADRIGRHADTISLVERSRTLPTIDLLLEISWALDVSIKELLPSQEVDADLTDNRIRLEAEIGLLLSTIPEHRLEYVREQLSLLRNLT